MTKVNSAEPPSVVEADAFPLRGRVVAWFLPDHHAYRSPYRTSYRHLRIAVNMQRDRARLYNGSRQMGFIPRHYADVEDLEHATSIRGIGDRSPQHRSPTRLRHKGFGYSLTAFIRSTSRSTVSGSAM